MSMRRQDCNIRLSNSTSMPTKRSMFVLAWVVLWLADGQERKAQPQLQCRRRGVLDDVA
jgi:hypothetical protein